MVDIKNIPAELKTSCRFCVWKFEKRNGQKTKMPYNPANGDRAVSYTHLTLPTN